MTPIANSVVTMVGLKDSNKFWSFVLEIPENCHVNLSKMNFLNFKTVLIEHMHV